MSFKQLLHSFVVVVDFNIFGCAVDVMFLFLFYYVCILTKSNEEEDMNV